MRKWLIVLVLAVPAFAAKTTVTDVLVKTTGGFCSGTISIQNPAFTSIDGPIAAATVTTNINGTTGRFTVNLEPGPYYTATYVVAPSGCTPTVEFWSVPVSATPVDLATVRTVAPPPPLPNTIPLSYITQSGATTGQFAKWDGTTWVPATGSGGGATIPNTTSALKGDGAGNALAVTGTGTDCVLVNGGSASCGSGGSGLTVGTTTIASGTTTRILYDNAGLLGEYSITGNGNVVLSNGPTLTLTNATLLPVSTGISGLGTGVATSLGLAVSGSGAICLVTSSSCSGNGTVVGAGSLTNTALVTGGGAQTILTPSATATLDTSGNISTPGSVSAGVGSGVAGTFECTQGTAPSLGTTSIKVYCPTSVTSYAFVLPAAAATGILHATNAANIDTLSISAVSLTADITGTLAAGNGGTGITSLGTGVATALGTAVSGTGAICLASGSACSGGGGSGSLILVESHTASTSASLPFTTCISATYDTYFVTIEGLVNGTNPASVNLNFNSDTTSGHYAYNLWAFGQAGTFNITDSSTTAIQLLNNAGGGTGASTSGYFYIYLANSASLYKQVVSSIMGQPGQAGSANQNGLHGYLQTAALTRFDLSPGSGTFTTGTARCYGIAH